MTITHLAYRLAHQFNGGVVALASMMGKGDKVLSSKLNPNTDTHHLNIEELDMLADFTNSNLELAEYFAAKGNAVVVPFPVVPDDGDMGLLDGYMAIMKELGELSSTFQSAYADGNITEREFEQINHEASDVIAKALAFVGSIKRVVR